VIALHLTRMRSIIFAVVVALSACAAGPTSKAGRVNVHAVRVEINSAIAGERNILSMGKVTEGSAEVYTQGGQGRRQEMWIKVDGAWKLQESHDLASAE
jgi:hypothetical protein